MAKTLNISTDILANLEYDPAEAISVEMNNLKLTSHCINKFVIPSISADNAAAKIKKHLGNLVSIEADQNCLPKFVVENHINLALSYFLGIKRDGPKKSGAIPSVSPLYDASSGISIFEVVHNVLLAFECGYYSIDIKFNASREKFLHELFCAVLGGKNMTPKNQWQSYSEDQATEDHIPYSVVFVFESGDLEAAAHSIASSFDDPVIPWRVRSIYVQESCQERFVAILKAKLRAYPSEMLRDAAFVAELSAGLATLEKLNAKTIEPNPEYTSGTIVPTICYEYGREYFDKPSGISSIVVLKSIRTVKEAITLAKKETGGMASIWTENISLAYELVNDLDYNTFWINCIGKLQASIPFTFRNYKNCIGSNFAPIEWFVKHSFIEGKDFEKNQTPLILEALKTASKIENSYHFEYFSTGNAGKMHVNKNTGQDSLTDLVDLTNTYWRNLYIATTQWKRKTVVFPFGITFAN